MFDSIQTLWFHVFFISQILLHFFIFCQTVCLFVSSSFIFQCCFKQKSCIKYRNFTWFSDVDILCINRPKRWGNWAFPQNFHNRKLCKIGILRSKVVETCNFLVINFRKSVMILEIQPPDAECPRMVRHALKIVQQILQDF